MIYTVEDIADMYSARRKNLPREEVLDLLKCITGFLKEDIEKKNNYAYRIPSVGVIYKKLKEASNDKMLRQIMFDVMFSDKQWIDHKLVKGEKNPDDYKKSI